MNRPAPKNIEASIRQRLLNHAKEHNEDFNAVLVRYALERLFYRVGISAYADKLCLKGARLFPLWTGDAYRPTKDGDFLSFGPSDTETIKQRFTDICSVSCEDDGLQFDVSSITATEIREADEYDGIRVTLDSYLGKARIPLQLDIGFGDAITPEAITADYPTILESSLPPRLLTYPRETVIAEKFEAIVKIGIANSRMKDFYDLWVLQRDFSFDGQILANAIRATFERRQTALPTHLPIAFTEDFINDETKQNQWRGFVNKGQFRVEPPELIEAVERAKDFLMPPVQSLNRTEPFPMYWSPGGPWHDETEPPEA